MPDILNGIWNFLEGLYDKAATLWQEFMHWTQQIDTSKIVEFIDDMPATPESLIQLCRITAIAAAAMGIISLISAMRLNNGLPIGKAKQFLAKRKQPVGINKESVVTILEIPNMEDTENSKKSLISYRLSEDAEMLLEKISVDLCAEYGWNIAPGGRTAA